MKKLSELIEEGSWVVKEDHNAFLQEDANGSFCGCAVGTALVAAGGAREPDPIYFLARVARLPTIDIPCPVCGQVRCGPMTTPPGIHSLMFVSHLHFEHLWPRYKIVQWLKPIEDAWELEHPEPAELETSEALEMVPA